MTTQSHPDAAKIAAKLAKSFVEDPGRTEQELATEFAAVLTPVLAERDEWERKFNFADNCKVLLLNARDALRERAEVAEALGARLAKQLERSSVDYRSRFEASAFTISALRAELDTLRKRAERAEMLIDFNASIEQEFADGSPEKAVAEIAKLRAELAEAKRDGERLDWLEKLATDGEDARSIEMEKGQRTNRKDRFWTWPLFKILPVGERVISFEWHRYSPEIRPGHGDEDYGGHWDIRSVEAPTLRAAIDDARAKEAT